MNIFGEWPQDQPTDGFEIHGYKRRMIPTSKLGNKKCQGIEKNNECYTFVVLKDVCMIVELKEDLIGSGQEFKFYKGCYEAGSIAEYERAEVGQSYDLKNVNFTIKIRNDPTNTFTTETITNVITDSITHGTQTEVVHQAEQVKMVGGHHPVTYLHWLAVLFGAFFWILCGTCCISCCWINWIDHKDN